MYRKNVASQFIYFQLNKTADGTGLTGATVAVRRCIDGTFAAGGGTVTEDLLGLYKYAMSQADTNGNDIGFQFTATGAITVEKTIVTTAADPTDSVRLGLTALPNAAAEAAGGLYTRGTGAGQINQDANGRVDANVKTWIGGAIPAVNVTGVPLIDLKYTLGTLSPATAGSVRADSVTGAVGSVTGAVGSVTAGVTVTTNNDKTAYALTAGERTSIADALLDRDMSTGADSGSTTVRTMRQALRFLRNKWSISAGTLTVCKEDDSTSSWTAAVTTDGTALPITANDPAGP